MGPPIGRNDDASTHSRTKNIRGKIFWHLGKYFLNGRLFVFELLRNPVYFTMRHRPQWPKLFALFFPLRYSPLYSSGKLNAVGHIYSASERNSGSQARGCPIERSTIRILFTR